MRTDRSPGMSAGTGWGRSSGVGKRPGTRMDRHEKQIRGRGLRGAAPERCKLRRGCSDPPVVLIHTSHSKPSARLQTVDPAPMHGLLHVDGCIPLVIGAPLAPFAVEA